MKAFIWTMGLFVLLTIYEVQALPSPPNPNVATGQQWSAWEANYMAASHLRDGLAFVIELYLAFGLLLAVFYSVRKWRGRRSKFLQDGRTD